MASLQQKVYDTLTNSSIMYEVIEHPAAYTIDEMAELELSFMDCVVKNLFVRDQRKKHYFLIVLKNDKTADLKQLSTQLQCGRLSFASEDSLYEKLGLTKGSVSPFGILNNTDSSVSVVFDKDILPRPLIGVHPNDNTATVLLKPQDMISIIESHGNAVIYI